MPELNYEDFEDVRPAGQPDEGVLFYMRANITNRDLQALQARAERLQDWVERLAKAGKGLEKYIEHSRLCGAILGDMCICGFSEAVAEWKKAAGEAEGK